MNGMHRQTIGGKTGTSPCAVRVFLLWLCLTTAGAALAVAGSVKLCYQEIMNFPVKYVTIDMNDPEVVVTTALAGRFPTGLESWSSLLQRLQPDAAINGTYFCLRTYMPVGDVAVNGALLYRGVVGTALCIDAANHVTMRPGPQQQANPKWTGSRTVLCAGPRLLTDGRLTINPRAEGFRDPHVLGSASRSAVAWRRDNTLILLTIEKDISLINLAYVCRHLGASDAMNLDGGTCSALFAEGRTVTHPGRSLSTVLAVYASAQRCREYIGQFASCRLPVLARLLPPEAPVVASTYHAVPYATITPDLPLEMRPIAPPIEEQPVPPPVAVKPTPPPPPPSEPLPANNRSMIQLTRPDNSGPLHGVVPVTVEVAKNANLSWVSLRINGVLRAMGNVWPLEYRWDSTKDPDGQITLEVTAWSPDRTPVARETRQVMVRNGQQVARH